MYFRYILLKVYNICIGEQLHEDLHGKQNKESQMKKELDVLTFEKKNLEMTIYDCDKF